MPRRARADRRQPRRPELTRLLADDNVLKLFHFGRFDMTVLKHRFGVMARPVYCTKIASKFACTFTDRHGLATPPRAARHRSLKQQQSSDWGAPSSPREQLNYAASDVLHLHALREKLDAMLRREGREGLARACFEFLPVRAELDLAGWSEIDPFAH
jgi:ribonuclease D